MEKRRTPDSGGGNVSEKQASEDLEADAAEVPRPGKRIVIHFPIRHNARLQQVVDRVNADVELYTLWEAANINAVRRLGMSDHGPVHVQIITNIALKLLRLLVEHGVQPSIVCDHNLTGEEAEMVVALASLTHDLGMSIHRIDHEQYSLFLTRAKLGELLADLYDVRTRTIITSEILHAIISHRSDGCPLTLEAGIVRVADSLDMAEGRSRIPFQAGKVDIHSLSAAAIEKVSIKEGEEKPIRIVVRMNNSAGIFQLDELVKHKLKGSGLEAYVEIKAAIVGEAEKKLIETFEI
ncbi:MAG: HD domain-containing protein [Deltaproteobacteria bacterium]|nr:HD domain-containing protein [Deltaproteobacteria bacterium]